MMNRNLDEQIRRNLSAEDQVLYDQLESDMNLQEMLSSTFQGKARWMKIYAFFLSFVFFLLTLYCLWGFMQTEDVRSALNWLMGFGFTLLSMTMLKMYFWMEMHKSAILREVKRVELQLSHLQRE